MNDNIYKNDPFEDAELFRKAITADLTEEERAHWEELLKDPRIQQLYEQYQSEEGIHSEMELFSTYSSRDAYLRYLKRKRKDISNFHYRFYRSVLRVASVVILIGLAVALVFHYRTMNTVGEEIEPGSLLATLTLSDGEIVQLNNEEFTLSQSEGVNLAYNGESLSYLSKIAPLSANKQITYNTLTIPIAGEFHVILEDGTKIWMNSCSTLKYPVHFEGPTREIELQGEAFFEVMHDTLHPFIVKTPTMKITVLGTTFNVNVYDTNTSSSTTLISGSVNVEVNNGATYTITPGEQVYVENEKSACRIVDTEYYTSWVNGKFIFQQTELEDIMRQIARWYGIDYEFANESIRKIPFTGAIYRHKPLNEFLSRIISSGDVKVLIKDHKIILESNEKE